MCVRAQAGSVDWKRPGLRTGGRRLASKTPAGMPVTVTEPINKKKLNKKIIIINDQCKWLHCNTCMIVWCVDVVRQLLLQLVHCLLLLMVHAHLYYPCLSTNAPKTTKCLKPLLLLFCLSFLVTQLLPAKKRLFAPKAASVGQKNCRRPSSSGKNDGWR